MYSWRHSVASKGLVPQCFIIFCRRSNPWLSKLHHIAVCVGRCFIRCVRLEQIGDRLTILQYCDLCSTLVWLGFYWNARTERSRSWVLHKDVKQARSSSFTCQFVSHTSLKAGKMPGIAIDWIGLNIGTASALADAWPIQLRFEPPFGHIEKPYPPGGTFSSSLAPLGRNRWRSEILWAFIVTASGISRWWADNLLSVLSLAV